MEVILTQDVPSLGKEGQIVDVSAGHARNFLLPQKKAAIATAGNLKKLEQDKKSIEVKREKLKKESEALAAQIAALTIKVEKQAGEENKIFGTISVRELSKALADNGITIDKRLIRIKDQIRQLGEYSVEIHLHSDVVALLKVEVTKK